MKHTDSPWLQRFYNTTLLLIFGLIVLHAPMSVWLGTTFEGYDLLIKSWKEILMVVLAPVAVYLLWRNRPVARELLRDKLLWLIGAYGALHLLLVAVFRSDAASEFAGLAIDLRYVLFFVLVYIALKLQPNLKKRFLRVGLVAAAVVLAFSLLQIFVLPKDALSTIGYGDDTIAPYITIDQNEDYVRINGTLRGPNPLGAYMVIIMAVVSASVLYKKLTRKRIAALAVIMTAPAMALWSSHSRSAWLAAAAALLVVGFASLARRKVPYLKYLAVAAVCLLVIVGSALYVFRYSSFVQNTVLHVNPESSVSSKSNVEHAASLIVGTDRALRQPFGGGVGSTGSASLLTDSPTIIESQYLFVAHETGWLGIGLFLAITYVLLWRLWRRRENALALGVFAAGIGLVLIGLLLPVWADDTVSLVWWGLAAVAGQTGLAAAALSPKTVKNSKITS
jgi:hypothetical protein